MDGLTFEVQKWYGGLEATLGDKGRLRDGYFEFRSGKMVWGPRGPRGPYRGPRGLYRGPGGPFRGPRGSFGGQGAPLGAKGKWSGAPFWGYHAAPGNCAPFGALTQPLEVLPSLGVTSIGPRGLLRRYRLLPGLPSQRGHPSVPRRPPGQPTCKATRPEKKQEALKALKHLRCTKGCWCSFFAEPVIS